jgi:tetratricopeptide (TPR) repeat protein
LHLPGSFEQAAEAYEKSLAVNPNQFAALNNVGEAYLQLGRAEDAKNILLQAKNVNPAEPDVHRLLGETYLRLGMKNEAMAEYEILKKIAPPVAETFAKTLKLLTTPD